MEHVFEALVLNDLRGGFLYETEEIRQPDGDKANGKTSQSGSQPQRDCDFFHRLPHGDDTAHVCECEEGGDESHQRKEWVLAQSELGGRGEVLEPIKKTSVVNGYGVAGYGGDGDGRKGAK